MSDKILWCVEACEGLHPMPSKSEAYRFAKRTRQFMKRIQRNEPNPHWPKVFVGVCRYPWSSEDHKKGLESHLEDKKKLITSPKKRRAIKSRFPNKTHWV